MGPNLRPITVAACILENHRHALTIEEKVVGFRIPAESNLRIQVNLILLLFLSPFTVLVTMAAHESAICVADYTAKEDGEISLAKGEKVLVRAYNNSAGTAQGEAGGNVGWFPTSCIEVEQHVNAFEFLAKSGNTPRKRSIVTDTNSLFDKKDETKESLAKFLQVRVPLI